MHPASFMDPVGCGSKKLDSLVEFRKEYRVRVDRHLFWPTLEINSLNNA